MTYGLPSTSNRQWPFSYFTSLTCLPQIVFTTSNLERSNFLLTASSGLPFINLPGFIINLSFEVSSSKEFSTVILASTSLIPNSGWVLIRYSISFKAILEMYNGVCQYVQP